jgi:hypothetical protein
MIVSKLIIYQVDTIQKMAPSNCFSDTSEKESSCAFVGIFKALTRSISYKDAKRLEDLKLDEPFSVRAYAKEVIQQAAALGIIKGKAGYTFTQKMTPLAVKQLLCCTAFWIHWKSYKRKAGQGDWLLYPPFTI